MTLGHAKTGRWGSQRCLGKAAKGGERGNQPRADTLKWQTIRHKEAFLSGDEKGNSLFCSDHHFCSQGSNELGGAVPVMEGAEGVGEEVEPVKEVVVGQQFLLPYAPQLSPESGHMSMEW